MQAMRCQFCFEKEIGRTRRKYCSDDCQRKAGLLKFGTTLELEKRIFHAVHMLEVAEGILQRNLLTYAEAQERMKETLEAYKDFIVSKERQ